MENGYIKLHRKILDNPIIFKDSDYFSIWCYLLLNATHKGYDTIFEKKRIRLNPGQLITGRKKISLFLKINESKVQRILKSFENEQQIEQQTGNKNRLITILNWELYQQNEQQNEQQVNNKRTTSEQQVNTYKNVKNVNNVNNNIINTTTTTIYDFIETNFGRTLSPLEITTIDEWLLWFEENIIKHAIKISVLNNKKTFNYTEGILKNWKACNYKTLEEIVTEDLKYKNQKEEKVELFDYDWLNDGD